MKEIVVMDSLTEAVWQESPLNMMFDDVITICESSTEQAEAKLEDWPTAFEKKGLKISRAKTECRGKWKYG